MADSDDNSSVGSPYASSTDLRDEGSVYFLLFIEFINLSGKQLVLLL